MKAFTRRKKNKKQLKTQDKILLYENIIKELEEDKRNIDLRIGQYLMKIAEFKKELEE